MDSKEIKIKNLSESRFGSIISLFRFGGIPCKMKNISTIYATYMKILIICTCTTYLGMFVDVYIHRDELQRVMANMRVLTPFTNAIWIYTYYGYVRALAISITGTQISDCYIIFLAKIKNKISVLGKEWIQKNAVYSRHPLHTLSCVSILKHHRLYWKYERIYWLHGV
jgi:hypothetical protein